ncbi:Quinone oxidoreductase PIG3 [Psilocybe cubensis]|uniref:Enoyl reductase (ER) domain-containing protein n=2 Tax=Psilocybe cubensis TaxID=181762 RepID=A0A8H8CEG9_PSICU|nr:Quinone oxidoreductase PIG3 [Psilocybe cubensis]KAH9480226.1 Quinone oxidoreductase PIG3 [Psilocybe cubensis]
MRAILVKGGQGTADSLYIGDAPTPTPRPTEVIVQIKAFGLNRMDISQREGKYPPPPGSSNILGVEFSGIISQLGSDVSTWKIGDEVLGLAGGGAYAEFIAVNETHIIPKPAHLTWTEAASIPEVFLTAFQALVVIGQVKQNDNVLVHAGASGVGVSAIQLARVYGARTVTATTSTQEKIDWLLNLPNGATHAANYKTEDFAAVVKEVTENKGANVVIDFVGRTHFNKNIEAMAIDGRMTMLALLSGTVVESVNLAPILYKRLHIEGSTLRSRSLEYQRDLIAKFYKEVFPKITGESGAGPIRTYIHKVYPWTEIQAAHREMEANSNSGKIIVEVV